MAGSWHTRYGWLLVVAGPERATTIRMLTRLLLHFSLNIKLPFICRRQCSHCSQYTVSARKRGGGELGYQGFVWHWWLRTGGRWGYLMFSTPGISYRVNNQKGSCCGMFTLAWALNVRDFPYAWRPQVHLPPTHLHILYLLHVGMATTVDNIDCLLQLLLLMCLRLPRVFHFRTNRRRISLSSRRWARCCTT